MPNKILLNQPNKIFLNRGTVHTAKAWSRLKMKFIHASQAQHDLFAELYGRYCVPRILQQAINDRRRTRKRRGIYFDRTGKLRKQRTVKGMKMIKQENMAAPVYLRVLRVPVGKENITAV